MDYRVAILIPCFNEEKTIGKVIGDFLKFEDKLDAIYIYDNNSTDKSAEIIKSFDSSKVKYSFVQKQGKGHVIKKMFQEIEADCYVLVDADDTYPAEMFEELVKAIQEEKFDMVVGDRLSSNYHLENTRKFHSFGNNLVKNLINFLFKANITDTMSGYRAFNRRFVKILPVLSDGFEVETEMTILALDYDFLIKEIPITYRNRIEGSSSKLNTYSDGFKVLKTIFILFKDFKPFEFFSFLAIIFAFCFLILFTPVLIEFLKTGLVPRFPSLIMSICFAIFSISFFNLGIVLSVIIKISKRNRKQILLNYKDK